MSISAALAGIGALVKGLLGRGKKNEISIGGNATNVINQAGDGNVATQSIHTVAVSSGRSALVELRAAIAELQLSAGQREVVEKDVGAIDEEMNAAAPSADRVSATLQGLVDKLKMANTAVDEGSKLGKAIASVARAAGATIKDLPGL